MKIETKKMIVDFDIGLLSTFVVLRTVSQIKKMGWGGEGSSSSRS